MTLFPIFLKIEGRPCLVVGAGPIGESKIASLLSAGAVVRVVAPQATATVAEWAARGRVAWEARGFAPADLDDVLLVVAAVPSSDLADEICREARRRGVLCNAVDDPPHCDFYYPAVVTRGDLQIAISTAGHSPALAQRVRQELEAQFGPEYEAWVADLGARRRELFEADTDPDERRQRLHDLASPRAFQEFVARRSTSSARRAS